MPSKRVHAYEHTCTRCGHKWMSIDPKPMRCGKCKSPYWDIPKKAK